MASKKVRMTAKYSKKLKKAKKLKAIAPLSVEGGHAVAD